MPLEKYIYQKSFYILEHIEYPKTEFIRYLHFHAQNDNSQKQPSRGALIKIGSENMQQIYRRTPMPKCDFNKVPKQLY